MTNPFAVLLTQAIQALHSFNTPSPEKHKLLLYTLGTTILATAIYKTVNFIFTVNNSDFSSADEEHQQPLFEDKYFKEYDEHMAQQQQQQDDNDRKECLENMYYRTVRETINDFYGDVIMCYDHATFSFAYYARTANIPYKYLETISRKYMIETNAPREIHVDIRDEYNKAQTKNTAPPAPAPAPAPASASASASASAPDTDVFVKLKSYNTAPNLNLHTANNANANNAANNNAANNKNNNNNAILREKANRYSYRGKLVDFHDNHKTFLAERRAAATAATTAAATDTSLKTGYADFKRQQKKSAL
jgi:hypothetical protein